MSVVLSSRKCLIAVRCHIYRHRDDIIFLRTRPCTQCRYSTHKQKDLEVFSNILATRVLVVVHFILQPGSMFAQVMFNIAIYC